MTSLLDAITERQDEILQLLRALTEQESPTAHSVEEKIAADHLATYLAGVFTGYGAEVERIPQPVRGDHLIARWGHGDRPALILSHYDTVWPLGTLANMPVYQVND